MIKNKTWFKIAFYSLLFGWFPFMFVAVWGSWNRDMGVIVACVGILLCMFGSIMMLPILKDNDLFKSIDELNEERVKYYEAIKRLEQKITEL